MYTLARNTKRKAAESYARQRFKAGIRISEWRQRLRRTNRLFESEFDGCWCPDHCAHSGGLHSYLEQYARVIDFLKPSKVLEWGPGQNSSIALAAGAQVVSIEQDERWLQPAADGHEQLVIAVEDEAYINPSQHWDADFYFVDSRRRSECIRSVHRHAIDRQHVLCLHDAQRRRYHAALRAYRYVRFLDVGTAVASDWDGILEL